MFYVPIIAASTRRDRQTIKVARFVVARLSGARIRAKAQRHCNGFFRGRFWWHQLPGATPIGEAWYGCLSTVPWPSPRACTFPGTQRRRRRGHRRTDIRRSRRVEICQLIQQLSCILINYEYAQSIGCWSAGRHWAKCCRAPLHSPWLGRDWRIKKGSTGQENAAASKN
jgi:hypothetical protein